MVIPETGTSHYFPRVVNYWLAPSDNMCSSSLGQQQKRRWPKQKSQKDAAAINMVKSAGVVQLHAACVVVHTQLPTIESPLCGLRLCISSRAPTNKEASRLSRSSAARRAAATKHTQRRRAPARGAAGEPQKTHSGTQSSHLKFTDRAVSGAEQERLKM